MNESILYLGDGELTGAAGYLGGILTHCGLSFDHVPSRAAPPGGALDGKSAVVISDYPSGSFRDGQCDEIVRSVAGGMGLVMIGGWDSYHGQGGNYHRTPLAEALCVTMSDQDDRVNCPQPCLIGKCADSPILADLPFDSPPGVGGYNRVRTKDAARTILLARGFEVTSQASGFAFHPAGSDPLLVCGTFGSGRVAAFTSDVAPHWVGGLVDWGDRRVESQAPGGAVVEVGNWYAQLFSNIVRWAARDI